MFFSVSVDAYTVDYNRLKSEEFIKNIMAAAPLINNFIFYII